MKKLKIAFITLGALLVLTITFFVGAFLGAFQLHMQDSAARGVLLVIDLKALRRGDVEKQIAYKESMLNMEIFNAMEFEKDNMSWVLFPFQRDNQEFLQRLATYRKEYPSTMKANPQDDGYPFVLANKNLLQQYGQGVKAK